MKCHPATKTKDERKIKTLWACAVSSLKRRTLLEISVLARQQGQAEKSGIPCFVAVTTEQVTGSESSKNFPQVSMRIFFATWIFFWAKR